MTLAFPRGRPKIESTASAVGLPAHSWCKTKEQTRQDTNQLTTKRAGPKWVIVMMGASCGEVVGGGLVEPEDQLALFGGDGACRA